MDATLITQNSFIMGITFIFILLVVLALVFCAVGAYNKAEIIISPITGFVVGGLAHKEQYTEEDKTFTEYTLQVLFGIISVNVLWRTQDG